MASRIEAINAYRPRINLGVTVQKPALLRAVSRATSLVEGTVDMAIKETRDQIIEICHSGRAVKVEGLGRFMPCMDLEGNLTISFKPDPTFSERLRSKGTFQGEVLNREHIGMTGDELVQMWNDNHPEDPIVSPEN